MKRATLFQVAREGWYILAPLIALVFVVHIVWGWWAAVPVVVLVIFTILFFVTGLAKLQPGRWRLSRRRMAR